MDKLTDEELRNLGFILRNMLPDAEALCKIGLGQIASIEAIRFHLNWLKVAQLDETRARARKKSRKGEST